LWLISKMNELIPEARISVSNLKQKYVKLDPQISCRTNNCRGETLACTFHLDLNFCTVEVNPVRLITLFTTLRFINLLVKYRPTFDENKPIKILSFRNHLLFVI
jgi:hypothetical protein